MNSKSMENELKKKNIAYTQAFFEERLKFFFNQADMAHRRGNSLKGNIRAS